jgi:steroid delta-isomerase-like uncharacterized protein
MNTSELIQNYYARFNATDWEGMLELLTDDVAHDVNESNREGGKEAFRGFLARMNHAYLEQIDPLEVMVNQDGTRASAEYIVRGTYQATDVGLPEARGQTYSLPGGAFFTVRDGKISRVTNYYNMKDWLYQIT